MSDQHPTEEHRIRSFVAEKVKRQGWGPLEAGAYARDRDLVSEFRAVIALTRLCLDDPERERPEHIVGHRAARVKSCVGANFIEQMARKFGFSEHRSKYLIEQYDADLRAFEGLAGSGSE